MIEQLEKPPFRYQDSILFKVFIITVITVALLIPSTWIQSLISDREGYQQQQMGNVSDSWSGSQLVQGPVLMLPYKKTVTETTSGKEPVSRQVTKILYVLPQSLQIKADVKTQEFKRGVYDATVYNAKMLLNGSFAKPDLDNLGIDPGTIMYDKARLIFSISDLKGLKNTPNFKINDQSYVPEPTAEVGIPFDKGLQVNFQMQKDQGFNFSYDLDIKGSNELNFLHTGKTTEVSVTSDWKTPDFNGRYLPDSRVLHNKGYEAKWSMLSYNRPYPQQWLDDDSVLTIAKTKADAVFGVKLQQPITQYREVTRTIKYSSLIIVLTFISLLLTELIRKQNVHLFNYILIGAAMVVYYTLLLSFSEQIGFNYAYLVSSASTILLISVFTGSLLHNRGAAVLFALILSFFYGFIFIIVQLENLSLLFGSVALFLIIAVIMYFSRKINWDNH